MPRHRPSRARPHPPSIKTRILKSIDGGSETSREVADDLGIPIKAAGVRLAFLVRDGILQREARKFYRYSARPPMTRYSYVAGDKRSQD